MAMRRGLRFWLGARAGHFLLERLLSSATFHVEGDAALRHYREEGKNCIFVLWHGRLLPLAYLHRGEGVVSLVSRSEDGEYLARVMEHWDYLPVRGSSSRGGTEALRDLVRLARSGRSLAITPDGPRGPRQKLKPGAILTGQLSGVPLVPVACGADRAWWFEGWDRFLVPKPFAKIRVAYGEPVEIPRDAGPEEQERIVAEMERELNRLMQVVDTDVSRR